MKCKICGKETNDTICNDNDCWRDHFWQEIIAEKDEHIIIDNNCYAIGDENVGKWEMRGFDGRKFTIKLSDGTIITTTNLWHQGTVPEKFRASLPNNAEFVNENKNG